MTNQILSRDGTVIIVIQACDTDWANIAVALTHPLKKHRNGWYGSWRVSVPELSFKDEPVHYSKMPVSAYRQYLAENREAILALIELLNREVNYV